MKKDNPTTRELISDLIEIESQIEYADDDDKQELGEGLVLVKKSIERKMENLDIFDFELNRKEAILDAEIQSYIKEIERLKAKKLKIGKIKLFFDSVLIPMVIKEVGKDNKYETTKKRYTLYKTYGKLEIDPNALLPNKYKKMKMEQYIDKKEARKDAIEADKKGKTIPGLTVKKVERVRKS